MKLPMKYSPAQTCLLACILPWALPAMAQTTPATKGNVAIGFVYNTEDSFRFGQYSGLVNEGTKLVGSLDFEGNSTAPAPRYWSLAARAIGLETGNLRATYALPGGFSSYFTFEQFPHYRFDDGNTVFLGSGTAFQTLPANWSAAGTTSGFSALNSSRKPFSIHKERERISTGFDWQFDQKWQLSTEYRHETKDGNETRGAIFGSTGGNPRGAILARPIEFQTDDMRVALAYANMQSQITLSYNAILFSNKQSDLLWQNPFNNTAWAAGSNFSNGAVGQLALEPDNRSSQFTISGGHSFDSGTRLSGSVATSTLRQDDSFLPYSNVQQQRVPLPRTDLGGKVENLVANLNFSTRLHPRSNLRLRYDYRDRDNKTPQAIYLRIAGDSVEQGTLLSDSARINRTYDLQSSSISADIDYRFTGKTKVSAGYEYEEKIAIWWRWILPKRARLFCNWLLRQ